MTKEEFYSLVEQHYRRYAKSDTRAVSRRYGHHNAEDIVQDSYVRVLEYWENIAASDPTLEDLANYMFIVRGRCASAHMAKERRHGMVIEGAEDMAAFTVAPAQESWHGLYDVARKIEEQSPELSRILKGALLEQRAYSDVAAACGVSEQHVKNTVAQFRGELSGRYDALEPTGC